MAEPLIGGQAVLEGVMMRSPRAMGVAVRRPDGGIVIRRDLIPPLSHRLRWLRWPLLRGAGVLFKSMFYGIRALNFSADVAMEAEQEELRRTASGEASEEESPRARRKREKRLASLEREEQKRARRVAQGKNADGGNWAIGLTIAFAMVLAVLVFLVVPLALTQWLAGYFPILENSLLFNLADGVIRMAIFLLYVAGISLMEEIKRFFQYHGAEHKAIFTFEAGEPLTVEDARRHGTLHPRCGTAFLLLVMVIAILAFSLIPRTLPFVAKAGLRVLLLPLIAGIGFELSKAAAGDRPNPIARALVAPGLWLQRITTRAPDDGMVEVALEALSAVLEAGLDEPVPQPEGLS